MAKVEQELVQSLAESIREKLLRPSEQKFTAMLQETKSELDHRTQTQEEQMLRRLAEVEEKLAELHKIQKRMGILCLALTLALFVNIVIQVI